MAAAVCMLSQLTPSTDQACGVVMSDVISMHSGVAKLLSARTGHQAQLIHAALGVGSSWTSRSKDSSQKRSKQWKFATKDDGGIKCSGATVDLQRLHSALVTGKYLTCAFDNWDCELSKDTFEALLKIAPWTKMERKSNGESSKQNGKESPVPLQQTVPKRKASKDSKPPDSTALPSALTDRGQALRSALAAATVLRQQLSRKERCDETSAALQQLGTALEWMDAEECDDPASGGPSGIGLGVEGDTVRPARPLPPRPHSGLTPAAPGRLPLYGRCLALHALTPAPAWQLTVVFPCTAETNVQLAATPQRRRLRLKLSNPEEARDPVKGLQHNGLVGMQPGVFTTDHIEVPCGRTMRDVTPPPGARNGKKLPRGELFFESAGDGKAWGFGQFGISLVPEVEEASEEEEFA